MYLGGAPRIHCDLASVCRANSLFGRPTYEAATGDVRHGSYDHSGQDAEAAALALASLRGGYYDWADAQLFAFAVARFGSAEAAEEEAAPPPPPTAVDDDASGARAIDLSVIDERIRLILGRQRDVGEPPATVDDKARATALLSATDELSLIHI